MFGFLDDIVEIIKAPISIASDAVRVITKPIADVAKDAAEEVNEAVKDLTD